MLTDRGIEANPDKCRAIMEMQSPTNVKEVQRLTGRIAALQRFLSCAADRAKPFFNCHKKNDNFMWTKECEQASTDLKVFLAAPPILTKPKPGIPLVLYLSVTDSSISLVLVQEEGKVQKPIYYVSRSLHGAEGRYRKLEKVALAMIMSARKLRPYFQSYQIIVKTD